MSNSIVIRCLRAILKPIMGFCLRHSLRIQDVLEAAKIGLIECAKHHLDETGEKITVSRLSVITGIHRRDISRIYKEEKTKDESRGLVSRVIGQWQTDARFVTKAGKPRVLTLEGEDSEFKQLVQATSNELHPATVLFELQRIAAVQKVPRGVRLVMSAYVPKGDPEGGFEILAKDAEDLISAVEENIFVPREVPNLHARTEYNRVREEAIPEIREWLINEGTSFHKKIRGYLSQFDLDINTDSDCKEEGARVSVGTYSKVCTEEEENE